MTKICRLNKIKIQLHIYLEYRRDTTHGLDSTKVNVVRKKHVRVVLELRKHRSNERILIKSLSGDGKNYQRYCWVELGKYEYEAAII